ncbi:MAG TPA: capsule assembly Wzi family protein [Nevskiaceae bacterium]|nr:capsule assembly Wzi family protein [Nevskiaceae bacterium]
MPFLASAATTPWLGVGDAGLRDDVELLAAYGVIDGPTTMWPIPSRQILRGLANQKRLSAAPAAVQAAAQRVMAHLSHHADDESSDLHPLAQLRTTNQTSVVRPFGARARDEADAQVGGDYDNDWFSARALVGEQTHYNGTRQRFSPDGSYLGARVGNLQFYGGWLDQWYGPGQTTSLILSNNARPFPKIGVMRADTQPFQTPLLSWLGPWQANVFLGLLDGSRIDHDTGFVSLRIDFEPLPGLQIGLTRETEICGQHHPCGIREYFNFNNGPTDPNQVNDEAGIDFKYTRRFGLYSVSPYVQFMNEDTGPFVHSATSYLAGTTVMVPFGPRGAYWSLTAEYADSVPTLNWFDFGKKAYGDAYNNSGYMDGFRYRGRTLGFSLDSDSRLFSLTWRLTDADNRRWHLTYYHADIDIRDPKTPETQSFVNVVSDAPVTTNMVEAGVDWPLGAFDVSAIVRGMDAVPVPTTAAHFAGELGIRYGF